MPLPDLIQISELSELTNLHSVTAGNYFIIKNEHSHPAVWILWPLGHIFKYCDKYNVEVCIMKWSLEQ